MKLGFSKLWRQAARSLGLQNQAQKSVEEPSQIPAERPALIGWLHEDSTARLASAEIIEQSGDDVVLRCRQAVESATKVWLIPPAGDGTSGTLCSCDEIGEGFRVNLMLDQAQEIEPDPARLGRVSLTWIAENGSTDRTQVAIKNGAEGELEISSPHAVPVPSMVLLSGYRYRGLGVAEYCRHEKDSYRLTVGMTEEVSPQTNAA